MRRIRSFALTLVLSALFLTAGADSTNQILSIDLPAVLRLAGARNLDIQLARERLGEAKANQESARWQFFPWISPGVGYRRHENFIQNVEGKIISTDKESYTAGPTITAQLDLGDAIYRNLAARQLVKAAESGLEGQRQESILAAVIGYFELSKSQAAVAIASDAVRISREYSDQVQRAVEAGIAFKGDALRTQVQYEKNQLTQRQALEQRSVAGARLVQVLHLEPTVELAAADGELVPINLVATNSGLNGLIAQAFSSRPELAQSRFLVEAARDARNGAVYGPLIPSVGAQAFVGGLGGGKDGDDHTFGNSQDYLVTLGWRIGPGGLFDRGRMRLAESRLKSADLNQQKLTDEVTRQVTETYVRSHSLSDQLVTARRALDAAEETLRLSQVRKEFAVGAVLEAIQAEQDLTRARLDYATIVDEHNKAQYALSKAIGALLKD